MSVAYRNNKKARKAARTPEEKSVAQRIRSGVFPKAFLVTDGSHLERDPKDRKQRRKGTIARLTWRMSGTYRELTKKEGALK